MSLNEPEVLAILKSILADDLGVDVDAVNIDALTPFFEDGLNLDSIVTIELITRVEQRFSFEFEDVDLRMATFENLRSLVKVIQARTH